MADEKITALRQWMAAQKLDAYIVPHADRFQSEYLRTEDERLAWLTGFTGSNGLAVILMEQAVLFTDGRYTLQASQQLDTGVFDVVESPPANPNEWLHARLKQKARIGYDPQLFTVAQMAQWLKGAADKDWELLGIESNPVDLLWRDKTTGAIQMASTHDLDYAGQTTEEKIARLLEKKSGEAGHILVSDPSLVCWLLNMRGNDVAHVPLLQSCALVDESGQVIVFADPQKIPPALCKVWGNHVSVETLEHLPETLARIGKPLQVDPAQCSVAIRNFCEEHGIKVIEASDPALLLRACKNATEIAGAEIAHHHDALAFKKFLRWFAQRDFAAEKITELDIIAKLGECRRQNGECVDDAFSTIAGFGPNGAIVHYFADEKSNRQLKPDNLLLVDSGGQYRNGTTDVTRTLAVGTPSAQMKTHYTAVLKGLIALSMTRFPVGTSGAQLDAIARTPVWALGLDYAHGTGHGVGSYLSVHEGPQGFSVRGTAPLLPGMILSIEPGIYLTGQYGIRLENLVVVVEDKRPGDVKPMLAFKTLTKIPFDERLIDGDVLSAEEREFLQQFK